MNLKPLILLAPFFYWIFLLYFEKYNIGLLIFGVILFIFASAIQEKEKNEIGEIGEDGGD